MQAGARSLVRSGENPGEHSIELSSQLLSLQMSNDE
jgi:hypothetical protein